MMEYPEPGRKYRHYKGGLYEVLFLSKHTETDDILITYKSIHFGSYYSRPIWSWNLRVEVDGKKVDRFEIVNE
jgi:hypothetical protein